MYPVRREGEPLSSVSVSGTRRRVGMWPGIWDLPLLLSQFGVWEPFCSQ